MASVQAGKARRFGQSRYYVLGLTKHIGDDKKGIDTYLY